jgi:hypothetical protein
MGDEEEFEGNEESDNSGEVDWHEGSRDLREFLAKMSDRLPPEQKEVYELLDAVGEREHAHILGWLCRVMLEPGAEFWSTLRQALYDSDFMTSIVTEDPDSMTDDPDSAPCQANRLGQEWRSFIMRRMNITALLSQLRAERDRIDQAIAALQALDGTGQSAAPPKAARRGRRKMSAAARKRIAAAQKKRWAAVKASKKR